ncbi:MAG TPA: hypothetical protein VKU01_35540 [Bryobacteraceae bacterium]|nr:hypothetical protein [Bryobacteraceae bacterium]
MIRIPVFVGAAIGVCSLIYFLCMAAMGPNLIVMAVAELLALAALARWGLLKELPQGGKATGWLVSLFCTALAAAVTSFFVVSSKVPHGEWDAWSIWNLHARFLERGGAQWASQYMKQSDWTHADYPLLLPGSIAQFWAYLHSETTLVPIVLAFLFTFGTIAIFVGAVRQLRGWDQALIAGIFLLCTSLWIRQGAAQYADVPVAFYMTAALALLCLGGTPYIVAAGAMAGLAAWTKNEGLMFVLLLVAARCVSLLRLKQSARIVPELMRFAAGLAPVLAIVALFKLKYAPPNDLLSHAGTAQRALDVSRYAATLVELGKHLFSFGDFIVPAAIIVFVYWYCVRAPIPEAHRLPIWTAGLTFALMLAGDVAVYILFPNDLDWQIQTSMERVLLQIWPLFLMMLFWSAAAPDFAPKPVVEKHRKTAATQRR